VAANAQTWPPPITSYPYFESFETGWGVWLPNPSNQFNWSRIQGPPPTTGTGPSAAYDGLWYAYTESSSPNYPGKTAAMFAGFNLSGVPYPCLEFYYHMYGSSMGTLSVDVYDGAWQTGVWSLTGQQQTSQTAEWRRALIPLTAHAFSNIFVQFRGVTGPDYYSDMAVDSVKVFNRPPNVYLDPAEQSGAGTPASTVAYTLTLENATPAARVFVFSYPSAWPVSGPGATLAPIPAGVSTSITAGVQIPADAVAGAVCTSTVRAISADNLYTNTALLITRCTWSYEFLDEPFDQWPHGWTNYGTAGMTPWYHDVTAGVPAPAAAHNSDAVTGGVSWLVSPPINLAAAGPESLLLSFYFGTVGDIVNEGFYISTGNPDPVAGDYAKLGDYAYIVGQWMLNQHDLTPYKGNNPVYLAFRYTGLNPYQLVDTISITGEKTGIGAAWLKSPAAFSISSYQASPSVSGALFIPGETGADGPAPNVTAQFGYGPTGTLPGASWNWVDAPYAGADGSNDLFAASAFITVSGMQDYAFRFRRGDASWVYADLDGSTNGYRSAHAGKADVAMLPPQGALLINQPILPGFATTIVSYTYPSNMSPEYIELADDLGLPFDAHIKSVRWAGVYGGARNGMERGFWLRIYAESNGVPGALLHEEFKQGYACEQALDGLIRYKYSANLATPFLIHAGQRYWLSIQHELVTNATWSIAGAAPAALGSNAMVRTTRIEPWWTPGVFNIAFEVYGASTNAGFVSGVVTAAHSGAPLSGAGVRATNAVLDVATTTGTNGAYLLTLPAGTYTLLATAPNYVPGVAAGVPVSAGDTTVRDFSLAGSVLTYGPGAIVERMDFGERVTNTVYVTNSGPQAVSYSMSIGNLEAMTALTKRVTASPVHLPPSDGVFENAPAALGPEPAQPRAGADDAPAARKAGIYPNVLNYGFNISLTPNDLVSFMTDTPGTLITNLPAAGASGNFVTGADFMGSDLGKLYCITYNSSLFFSIDVANAATTMIAVVPPVGAGQMWTGMAASPDGKLYVCSTDISTSKLYSIDPASGALAFIGVISNAPAIIDIAVSPLGEMYGVDLVGNNLVKINTATGEGTIIGSIGFDANYAQGMDFDHANNILYLAAYNNSVGQRQLRAADVMTGNTTNLGALAASIDGFAVATPMSPLWVSISTNAGTLAAGAASSFDVVFDSGVVSNGGVYTADLTFHGNFVNAPPALPLAMIIATAPIISAPESCAFPDTVIGEAATQSFAVANIGIGVLTGAVSGVAAPFSLAGPAGYFIPAESDVQITVAFTPPAEGVYSNVIALSGGGGASVALTGAGVPEPSLLLSTALLALGIRRRGRPVSRS
ncbi:hypothetical protein GX586_12510, partial [bacterium]|nr:hypothetical protein [bacterium]